MLKFSFMITGEHDKEEVLKHLPVERIKNLKISPATSVYPTEQGCPMGGQNGLIIEGECDDLDIENIIASAKSIMASFSQKECTVDFLNGESDIGRVALSEGGQKEELIDTYESKMERFSVKIPMSMLRTGSIEELCKMLQNNMLLEEGRTVTGVVRYVVDEEGQEYYEFSGTQNPLDKKQDKDVYQKCVVDLVQSVVDETKKNNLVIDFKELSVVTDLKGKDKPKDYSNFGLNQIKLAVDDYNNEKEQEKKRTLEL